MKYMYAEDLHTEEHLYGHEVYPASIIFNMCIH